MTDAQVHAALKAFGVTPTAIFPAQKGYRNSSYQVQTIQLPYNLLIYKNELGIVERIKRTNLIGQELDKAGLPVRFPLDPRILKMRMGVTRYAVLYNYLSGQTVPWEAFTMKHIKLLGWAMGTLHCAMTQIRATDFTAVPDEYSAVVERMQTYFAKRSVQAAIQKKLSLGLNSTALTALANFLAACKNLPDQQVLHMDFVRGNVLFGRPTAQSEFYIDQLALTGIIDFEKAVVGHPLFDIARTLSFLLVDCSQKSSEQIKRYFLNSGYIKRGKNAVKPLSVKLPNGENHDVLETAISLFLFYDFYKFLRSNPYESLHKNYHYVRTAAELSRRGVLVPT